MTFVPAASVSPNHKGRREAVSAPSTDALHFLSLPHMLTAGGDDRLHVGSESGRNTYGIGVAPAEDEIWFSSSTASGISDHAYRAAELMQMKLVAGAARQGGAAGDISDFVRERIAGILGINSDGIVLCPSGTEAELTAIAAMDRCHDLPITSIVVAPSETGRGVMKAAAGCHFRDQSSLGGAVDSGRRLAGLEHADITIETVDIRESDGAMRDPATVDREVAAIAERALARGRCVLLHVLDVSKTGLPGVSRAAASDIRALAPDRVQVVVDACQLRAPMQQTRADLARGFLVMITGSKFAGGPPFSGALILTDEMAERLRSAPRAPQGLCDYSAGHDWPKGLRSSFAGDLQSFNIGLALRWRAALAELERLMAVEPGRQQAIIDRFEALVQDRARHAPFASPLCDSQPATDHARTIVPLVALASDGSDLCPTATKAVHRLLRAPLQGALNDPSDRVVHVGQPVTIGGRSILRVCASAAHIADISEAMDQGASLEAAFDPIDRNLDILFTKWAAIAQNRSASIGGADLAEPDKAAQTTPQPAALKAQSPLDPDDWHGFRAQAHQALDAMIDDLSSLEDGPVWRSMPDDIRARFTESLPRGTRDLEAVLDDFHHHIAPYGTGNRHPLFMGWVHGAGTPVGMVAEMLAAGLNANCGGRDHVGLAVEQQITRWMAELFQFPETASGIFVTGTSMANFLGVLVARTRALGDDSRSGGMKAGSKQLTAYASTDVHGCMSQALDMAGIGAGALRGIATDDTGSLRIDALEAAIDEDLTAGHQPFLVVGTAGSVNIGAIDPLAELAATARQHGLWFHVDGAFGALAKLSPALAPRLAGIEQADSIAFDFHKWAHVPYDAGFLLVRDAEAHKRAFASPAAYLQRAERGLAAGETWPCDLGPDLSRGFRALKTWFTLQTLGADRIGDSIETCCRVARHLEKRLRDLPILEMVAPAQLNIVCWRLAGADRDHINEDIVADLHERGLAAPSMTMIGGRPAIRAAIVNHRTREHHIDRFVEDLDQVVRARLILNGL